MGETRVCAVMAFDSGMFHQGRECIKTMQRFSAGYPMALNVLNLGLLPEEVAWLRSAGAQVRDDLSSIPNFAGAPGYARALTCRPYMRDLFPGYDIYFWVDADIRFAAADAFETYLRSAAANPQAIVICQEVDPTFSFVRDPVYVGNYHRLKNRRLKDVYGGEILEMLQSFLCFNAGIFAMHRDSAIWENYRLNLERALQTPFDHMKEQDAMNVAILQSGMRVCVAPSVMNWLCSISMPVFSPISRWVRPAPPAVAISVLHLTNSNETLPIEGKPTLIYDYYRQIGITE